MSKLRALQNNRKPFYMNDLIDVGAAVAQIFRNVRSENYYRYITYFDF